MQRSAPPRTARVLLLAVAPVLAATSIPASAGVVIRNVKPGPGAASAPAAAPSSLSDAAAAPTFVPQINGFQPFVVMGLTDENDGNGAGFYSPKAAQPGSLYRWPPDQNQLMSPQPFNPAPNPPRYIVGTLDSGGQTTILSYDDAQTINLFQSGLEGAYSIPVSGAGGEQEELDVSDALGQYITGLGNATPSATGPVVPQSSLRGMWNTSILSVSNPDSVIPTLVGNPVFAHWQVVMRNSQTQRLRVGEKTWQGPQVELRNIDTPHDNTFVRVAMSATSMGSANSFPVYVPDFFGSQRWEDNPQSPTVWNFMGVKVDLGHTDSQNKPHSISQTPFLFDTGAQVSVISTETANLLGINTGGGNPDPPDFTAEVLGVGGIRTVNGYYIDNLSIVTDGVDLEAGDVPVLVLDIQDPLDGVGAVPGILGMNLFNDRDVIVNAKYDVNNNAVGYLAFSEFALPQPKWTATAGGNWGDISKWYRGVPWQPGEVANFTASAAPQTINVDANDGLGPYAMARINFDSANRYTLSGPGSLRLEELVGNAAVQVSAGSHTIGVPLQLASTTNLTVIPAASTLTISGEITSPNKSGVVKTGQGTAEVKRLVDVGAIDVQAGRLKVLPGSGGAAGTSSVADIKVAPAAQVDLTNNNLIVRDGAAGTWNGSNYTGVQGLVRNGRADSAWNGTGGIITSESDATSGLTTLAVSTAAQVLALSEGETGTWSGASVAADDILVMYTYAGDANLDGAITGDDYSAIDFGILFEGMDGYANGDFNYDGFVTGDDYSVIDLNILLQGPPIGTGGSLAAVSAVPEPSAAACGFALLAGVAARRRRRRALR